MCMCVFTNQVFCYPVNLLLQALMIVVIINEKNQGIPSSGIQFCFWGALVIYASIKLRTLILLSRDQVHELNTYTTHTRACVCVRVHTKCTHTHTHTCAHVHTHTHTYICTHIHAMCTHMWECIHFCYWQKFYIYTHVWIHYTRFL